MLRYFLFCDEITVCKKTLEQQNGESYPYGFLLDDVVPAKLIFDQQCTWCIFISFLSFSKSSTFCPKNEQHSLIWLSFHNVYAALSTKNKFNIGLILKHFMEKQPFPLCRKPIITTIIIFMHHLYAISIDVYRYPLQYSLSLPLLLYVILDRVFSAYMKTRTAQHIGRDADTGRRKDRVTDKFTYMLAGKRENWRQLSIWPI